MSFLRPIEKEAEAQEVSWAKGGRWWVGRVNLLASASADLMLPGHVRIVDATLREGEEVPDTVLTEQTKLELAQAICNAGFNELEVGYAGVIQEHFDLVRRLRRERLPITISSHTRIYGHADEWQREIDRNLEAGASFLTMVGCASEIGTAPTPWLSKEAVPDRVANCVSYAKAQGAKVSFGLADLVRTTLPQIVACYHAAAEAGVDRVYIYDAMGAARPEGVRFVTRFIKDLVGPDVELGVHVHDNYGLSHANAIAALTAGASVVDAVPLGLGDGGGITASEEVASAMEVLYGVSTGVRLDRLSDLCARVAAAFGIAMPKTKAVVGENSYWHQIDSHVAAILRGAWYAWEVAKPEVFGHRRRLSFGHAKLREGRSGAVAALFECMGVSPSDEELRAVMDALRMATKDRPSLDVAEAERIVRRVLGLTGDDGEAE